MAMIYTLVTSAKEWLSEQYCQDTSIEDAEAEEAAKDDVWIFSSVLNSNHLVAICVLSP